MSWDVPTGDKCPKCNSALVSTARGGIKCGNKDCAYKVKEDRPEVKTKGKSKAPAMQDDFTPPPLMEEPQYFEYEDENAGYFPADFEE